MEYTQFESPNADGSFMKFVMEKHRHHGWSLTASDGRYWNDGKFLCDGKWKFVRDISCGQKEMWEVEFGRHDWDGETVVNTIWHNTEPHGFDQWTPVQKFHAKLVPK